jgi:hypothetical protein
MVRFLLCKGSFTFAISIGENSAYLGSTTCRQAAQGAKVSKETTESADANVFVLNSASGDNKIGFSEKKTFPDINRHLIDRHLKQNACQTKCLSD